ncbi:MAG: hypothetical protein KGJ54_15300 [Betaproteobacteria bacterium]|jgi:hypothetical protein|uniref:hypothetical protein n=1 Tax=unclassified Thiomonas TaxID=2625466 RepID=UPI000BD148E5|nr:MULTISPECIES: hypothetical protein [unclassified Thiomonas]MDE2176624.1 hypothetical protein [Betaproteobacteria bacterium]MDE2269433.1 hypothetical protein [Betaproteobacteria bacterium]OZB68816.1 MAG: hypothetical protein B7X30_15160 [Thiomonas sp. 13-64-67]
MVSNPAEDIPAQHVAMLAAVQRMRLGLLAGDLVEARAARDLLQGLHAAHIGLEETALIPKLPTSARWSAKVYLAEHAKLSAMLGEWREILARQPDRLDPPEQRLVLLDASAPLQHLLEHHFEREEKGLLIEARQ